MGRIFLEEDFNRQLEVSPPEMIFELEILDQLAVGRTLVSTPHSRICPISYIIYDI